MVKIREYRVHKKGKRGRGLSLPPEWTEDWGIRPKDIIEVYRNDRNQLILVPKNRKEDAQGSDGKD